MRQNTELLKLALEAAEVLEKLFTTEVIQKLLKQAEAMAAAMHKGLMPIRTGPVNTSVDCQITVDDIRKGQYAADALREALAEQPVRCPQKIIHAITAYGDARADQDANNAPTTSHERLADCIRLVREELPAQPQQLTDAGRDAQEAPFETWWEMQGQYLRAGGGQYEKTFAWHAWCAASPQPAKPHVIRP